MPPAHHINTPLPELLQAGGASQQAIDQLVQGRPKLAAQLGDVFIQDQDKDWPRAVEIYSRGLTAKMTDDAAAARRHLSNALALNPRFSPLFAPRAARALRSLR